MGERVEATPEALELLERWGRPAFLIDASPGAAEGFSLDALEKTHLVTRTA